MSGNTTKRMLSAYYQEAEPVAHFSGMFQARPENFYSTEEIEIDIVRSEEDVSIVIEDLSTGYRMNSDDLYTNKAFKAPIHKEAVPLNAHELIKRMPGATPFDNPDVRANLIVKMFSGMRKVERKIRRAIELQSAQVMQTAKVTLTDSNGVALYTLDFKPKPSHFPIAGVAWDSATLTQKLDNLLALANIIRGDGLRKPDQLHFGESAWENLIQTSGFLDRLDKRRADLGTITAATSVGEGGIYHGTIEVGNYKFDLYTYDGRYKHPQTGVSTPFLDPAKIVMRASTGRLDATFGLIPNIGAMLGANKSILPELPGRMSSSSSRMDLFTNVWLDPTGEQIFGGVGARPLMIPTDIDTYGCLDTGL